MNPPADGDGSFLFSRDAMGNSRTWSVRDYLPSLAVGKVSLEEQKNTKPMFSFDNELGQIMAIRYLGDTPLVVYQLSIGDTIESELASSGCKIAFGTRQGRITTVDCTVLLA